MDMTHRIAAVAVVFLSALAVTTVADAGGKHTYRASLAPVSPAATTAGVSTVRGKAQLVDGKRNNKISLHVRGLAPRTTYIWHIHQGSCAATGAPLPGWTYRSHDGAGNGTLTTNHSGGANTKARSISFNADPAQAYSVNVHVAAATNGLPAGTIVACGDLTGTRPTRARRIHCTTRIRLTSPTRPSTEAQFTSNQIALGRKRLPAASVAGTRTR